MKLTSAFTQHKIAEKRSQLCFQFCQFSYQKDCSTTMCTWIMVETVDYFLRNNSEIFSCFLDTRKAFDTITQSVLFKKLHNRNLSPIFTRLLLVMYLSQTANVRWARKHRTNSTFQTVLKKEPSYRRYYFAYIYIDDVIKQLR